VGDSGDSVDLAVEALYISRLEAGWDILTFTAGLAYMKGGDANLAKGIDNVDDELIAGSVGVRLKEVGICRIDLTTYVDIVCYLRSPFN
jgi:hypothetical protein